MGCWIASRKHDEAEMNIFIKYAIDHNNTSMLRRIFQDLPSLHIDAESLQSSNFRLNALGYSLFSGKPKCFHFLHSLGASVLAMEEILDSQGYRGVDLICIQGSLPMLKLYLPIHLSTAFPRTSSLQRRETLCLDSDPSMVFSETKAYTPIQYACIHQNLKIIKYLQQYFSGLGANIPALFDINYQDEVTGENCPLIACRLGVYKLVKFLFEHCNGNFHVRNKCDENALLVLAASSRKTQNLDFFVCLEYLLKVVKVDPRHKYEEVVLLINNYQLLELYCAALEGYGIVPDKEQLERRNEIKAYPESQARVESEIRCKDEHSVISSIKEDIDSNPCTIDIIMEQLESKNEGRPVSQHF